MAARRLKSIFTPAAGLLYSFIRPFVGKAEFGIKATAD